MANEKNINSRIQHKHDIETNWLKATNFMPKVGELIIYDPDDNYTYSRFKIGDGKTLVNNLPFAVEDINLDGYALAADVEANKILTDAAIAEKQDKITGTAGQFVVIGDDGRPTTKTTHTHKWSDIEDPICGESFGDTLTWDGNREGRTESLSIASYPSYKCSDAVVTLEDIANGLSYTLSDGRTRTLEPNEMSPWIALDSFIYEHFAIVNNEYAAELGYEPGIFLTGYEDAEEKYIYVKSLTIPGYTGFLSITKLDAKFLPDDVVMKNEIPYIPIPTQLDNNKFLRVVNSVPDWVAIPIAEEATF